MPIRLGKSMRKVLAAMAYKQERGIRVNFLIDELTTRECKAIRQMQRKLLRPVPELTPAQKTWLRGITPEAFSLEKAVQLYANLEKK